MMAYGSTSFTVSIDEVPIDNTVTTKCQSDVEYIDSEITFKERLKICCKPKYQPRKLKNKGAILVLVWNFFATTVFYYLYSKSVTPDKFCTICFHLIPLPTGLVMFFAGLGWLADVYFERYKVLRWSIIIMWISSLLLTTTFVVEQIVTFTNYYQLVFIFSLGIGFSIFQVNIVQFGIDQLTDASSDEIVSFIYWYAWTFVSNAVLIKVPNKYTSPQYKFIVPLILCVALSIVASSLFLCNKVLIKEPVIQNPYKLIYRVLKYALRHKYARQRSAFTYCEDDIPSRLDFGKSKYGGPFTTEQVEDVKIFLRALALVLIVSAIFGMREEDNFHTLILNEALTDKAESQYVYTFIFSDLYYIAATILIPFHEIIIHPVFQRCLPSISSHRKVGIGLTLQVIRYILMVILVTLTQQRYLKFNEISYNDTLASTCIFNYYDLNISVSVFDFRLYAIADVVSFCSILMILIGTLEFLCAQIPYSMKGVLAGLFYGSLVVFFALNKGITMIFNATSSVWSADALFSCGFWYLQTKLVFILIAVFTFIIMAIVYKKRKREDVLPNEHIFAERYYSKKLQQVN